jgi:hypothetical protein
MDDLQITNEFEDESVLEQTPSFSKGYCFKCGALASQKRITMHEPLMGAKYRNLSIEYGLRVPLCQPGCHELVQEEPSQEYNKYLQILMQQKFERENPDKSFLKIFHRNYL